MFGRKPIAVPSLSPPPVEASAALPDFETAPPPSVQPATAAPPSTNPPGPRPVTAALDRRAEALKTTHARIQTAL
jgi:hypothetical protein